MSGIVADTSALTAVVAGESDAHELATVLAHNVGGVHVSAATLVEALIVVESRQGADAVRDLERLLESVQASIVPVDHAQAAVAAEAWRRFGKGRHAAALNYGDCFSYALARHLDLPLLYKGGDFARTDIVSAL